MGAGNSQPSEEQRREYMERVVRELKRDEDLRRELFAKVASPAPEDEAKDSDSNSGNSEPPREPPHKIEHVEMGEAGTTTYRLQARALDEHLSLWHDVPLRHEGTPYLHFVCEIPKWTKKKFEIATDEHGTPIKQDEKKGVLREFKTGASGCLFNYGCLPQTWEDPEHIHPDCGVGGDNDPLDVCEIGMRQIPTGGIRVVKVLGVLCMIDEGEADWKILTIDVNDHWAPLLNDVSDVEQHIPGLIDSIREWFRNYKVADGKPQNSFGLNEECMPAAYANKIVSECNQSWFDLISGKRTRSDAPKITSLNCNYRLPMLQLSPDQITELQKLSDKEEDEQMSQHHKALL
ncbi:Inorganic pyrophosphatase [Hondaea fermentalgiana]|uniref:inorganic diphosphatase n=1 Tax=Hondaea fermentalgiana TaxID=2315210 RepID=A0A2R5GEZ0_9STRA|nr:Inorganic pyrophosphatase [Hondaea fermentalgiana]|eukprot:GBG29490.1 Inorganic pyrophosphatase [Hondaea fermentalgiana]